MATKQHSTKGFLEPRDGPTEEFKKHHRHLTRLEETGAHRRLWRREQLAIQKEISPQACEAGWQFARDYLTGVVGHTTSSLDVRFGDGGFRGREITDVGHEAAKRYDAAAASVDKDKGIWAGGNGERPSYVLMLLCVEDISFARIGRVIRKSPSAAQAHCRRLLELLALHYKEVDEKRGRSQTAATYEAALRRFDPKMG